LAVTNAISSLRPESWTDEEIENADSEDYGRYMGSLSAFGQIQMLVREAS
jgi:hypothetical protein